MKYNKEFSNYISIMKEALERENFEAYDAARVMLDESIEERKEQKALEDQVNTTNFGVMFLPFEGLYQNILWHEFPSSLQRYPDSLLLPGFDNHSPETA